MKLSIAKRLIATAAVALAGVAATAPSAEADVHRQLYSVQVVDYAPDVSNVRGATLCEHPSWGGKCLFVPDPQLGYKRNTHRLETLTPGGEIGWHQFNDRISSLKVSSNCILYTFSDEQRKGTAMITQVGAMNTWGSGDDDLRTSIMGDDRISSLLINCF